MDLANLSVTAASNTSAPPNGAPESTTTLADTNDIARQLMALIRRFAAADTIAAAATTDLGTKDAAFLTLTGAATTITGFGTIAAGIYKFIIYNDAHSLTYNATSMILLGNANRTVAAGDVSLFVSEGSGNWRELLFSDDSGFGYLTDIGGLTPTDGNIIVGNGTTWVAESGATARTSLGLAIGTDVQAYDATLTAFAGGLTAANKIPYATALNTLGELDFKDEDAMTSNSATAVPSQQSVKAYVDTSVAAVSAGAWELVSTTTVTATSAITFDLQEDVYCEWKFVIDGVIPATDDSTLRINMGYSNGTLFETSAYGLSAVGTGFATDVNAVIGNDSTGNGVGTAAGEHAHAVVTVSAIGATLAGGFLVESACSYVDAANQSRSGKATIWYTGTTERVWDTARFLWEANGAGSGGNFEATGTIKMFGLKRAG